MVKKIIQLGDKRLVSISSPIEDPLSDEAKSLIADLQEVLNSNPDKSAGLSAPQIGVNKKIIVCRRTDIEPEDSMVPIWEVMINPRITFKSKEKSIIWEGCLSIQDGGVFGAVERPENIVVEYINPNGRPKELKANDYFSHIVQHEIDHLDGVLFLSYVKDLSKLYNHKELSIMEENDVD